MKSGGRWFISGSRAARLVLGLGALALGGCVLETGGDVTRESDVVAGEAVGEVQQAICNPATSDTCCDSSKYTSCSVITTPGNTDFKVKFYHCPATPESMAPSSTCEVEPGWTLIGGGARVVSPNVSQGVVTANKPDQTFSDSLQVNRRWRVSSVARDFGDAHAISAHAIGMKMAGYDNVNHLSPIKVTWSGWAMPFSSRPQAGAQVPAGELLLGGGWDAGSGSLGHRMWVVDAYPVGMRNGTFVVNGSDLDRNLVDSVQAYAISIARCPSRWSSCFSDRRITTSTGPTGTGQRRAAAITAPGFLTTGIGFNSSSWHAPVYDLFPFAISPSAPQGSAIAGIYPIGLESAAVTAMTTALAR
jgi:hypothetical protein